MPADSTDRAIRNKDYRDSPWGLAMRARGRMSTYEVADFCEPVAAAYALRQRDAGSTQAAVGAPVSVFDKPTCQWADTTVDEKGLVTTKRKPVMWFRVTIDGRLRDANGKVKVGKKSVAVPEWYVVRAAGDSAAGDSTEAPAGPAPIAEPSQ